MRANLLIAIVSACALGACVSAVPPSGAASPAIGAPVSAQFAAPVDQPSGMYALDPAHASVLWRVSHFGLSMYTGRFNTIAAQLDFDGQAPQNSKISVTIAAASVDTGHQALGGKKDFNAEIANAAFGAEKNPQITFVSTSVTRTGPASGKLIGDLTLNGVTKPDMLDVTFYGGKANPFNGKQRLGFAARGKIKRADWGVTNWAGAIGEDVELVIEAEFQKQ